MKIKVKKLTDTAVIPTRGSKSAAGYDLYADISSPVTIPPHANLKIGTGLAIAVPDGYFGALFPRSGLATKNQLRPANCVGVCDSDYRGEYIVSVHNDSDEEKKIEPGERIAQLIVLPYLELNFEEVNELDNTERGSNGFGSTGM